MGPTIWHCDGFEIIAELMLTLSMALFQVNSKVNRTARGTELGSRRLATKREKLSQPSLKSCGISRLKDVIIKEAAATRLDQTCGFHNPPVDLSAKQHLPSDC